MCYTILIVVAKAIAETDVEVGDVITRLMRNLFVKDIRFNAAFPTFLEGE